MSFLSASPRRELERTNPGKIDRTGNVKITEDLYNEIVRYIEQARHRRTRVSEGEKVAANMKFKFKLNFKLPPVSTQECGKSSGRTFDLT